MFGSASGPISQLIGIGDKMESTVLKTINRVIDNRIFKRLSVAYGMSFMSENLTNCMFPSDIKISTVQIEIQRGHNPAADYEET
jgi:hypothetical protein